MLNWSSIHQFHFEAEISLSFNATPAKFSSRKCVTVCLVSHAAVNHALAELLPLTMLYFGYSTHCSHSPNSILKASTNCRCPQLSGQLKIKRLAHFSNQPHTSRTFHPSVFPWNVEIYATFVNPELHHLNYLSYPPLDCRFVIIQDSVQNPRSENTLTGCSSCIQLVQLQAVDNGAE